jgi:hypothetical protein
MALLKASVDKAFSFATKSVTKTVLSGNTGSLGKSKGLKNIVHSLQFVSQTDIVENYTVGIYFFKMLDSFYTAVIAGFVVARHNKHLGIGTASFYIVGSHGRKPTFPKTDRARTIITTSLGQVGFGHKCKNSLGWKISACYKSLFGFMNTADDLDW